MRNFLLLLTVLFMFGLQAGDQGPRRMSHRSQRGDHAKRGKKRNQARAPKATSLPGLDVQLGQARNSTQSRDRQRARQEIILLDWTKKPGSAEQLGAVKALLEAHIDPNMRWTKKCNVTFYGSPLCNAAARGNVALVQLLLAHKDKKGDSVVDPNAVCLLDMKEREVFTTPLHAAARAREDSTEFDGHYPEVIDLLCAHYANVNAGGDSPDLPFTPAHMVALQHVRLSQRPKDAELNAKKIGKQLSVMRALINCGADLSMLSYPEARGKSGISALAYAAKRGNLPLIDFLAEEGGRQYEQLKSEFTDDFSELQKQKSEESLHHAAKKLHKARRLRRAFRHGLLTGDASVSGVLKVIDGWE